MSLTKHISGVCLSPDKVTYISNVQFHNGYPEKYYTLTYIHDSVKYTIRDSDKSIVDSWLTDLQRICNVK